MALLVSYLPITDPTLIFFVVLLIILFAPIVMSKLRIPHIIGMVLAGVMIGQYGFDILERDNSFELFGRVGLYYIMFLAGLEMDMEGVKKHTRRFLIFGLLTCFVPLLLTYVMAMTILDYSPAASFLLGCYHGIEHAHCLSYHRAIWFTAAPKCRTQCWFVDDLAVYGSGDAGSALKLF